MLVSDVMLDNDTHKFIFMKDKVFFQEAILHICMFGNEFICLYPFIFINF
jgi:hypothetical protein